MTAASRKRTASAPAGVAHQAAATAATRAGEEGSLGPESPGGVLTVWRGNVMDAGSRYVSDGTLLFVAAACDGKEVLRELRARGTLELGRVEQDEKACVLVEGAAERATHLLEGPVRPAAGVFSWDTTSLPVEVDALRFSNGSVVDRRRWRLACAVVGDGAQFYGHPTGTSHPIVIRSRFGVLAGILMPHGLYQVDL